VRSPSPQTLPTVLTRDEVKRLFTVIREERFRVILRLIYACGLRVSEAINLEVGQIKRDWPRLHLRKKKFSKELLVPLPSLVNKRMPVEYTSRLSR
jgi:integrase